MTKLIIIFGIAITAAILLGAIAFSQSALAKGDNNGQPKVTICHVDQETGEEKTISISNKALSKHLANHIGDHSGECVDEPEPPFCESNPCDDGNECTTDVCDEEGNSCSNDVNAGAECGTDGTCDAGGECVEPEPPFCELNDCDDNNVCTIDVCDEEGNSCSNTNVADGLIEGTCDTGLDGVCAQGQNRCSTGELECEQTVFPTTEVCDDLDNDCDGFVDEDGVCEPPVLGTFVECECRSGDDFSVCVENLACGTINTDRFCLAECKVRNGAGDIGDNNFGVCFENNCSPIEPVCGDGNLDPGEACDDGNSAFVDGCSPSCVVESGWNCDNSNPPSVCSLIPVCGNGIIEAGETCEPPNTATCNASCQARAPVCGDNFVTPPETCDDGNLVDGDGCSSVCEVVTGTGPFFLTCVCSGTPINVPANVCLEISECTITNTSIICQSLCQAAGAGNFIGLGCNTSVHCPAP